jgi:hypothetical protein
MLATGEVLRAEHLHCVIDGDSGADRVGADALLGPEHPLFEDDAIGVTTHPGMPLHPQDPALRVNHDDDVLGVLSEPTEDRAHRVDASAQPAGLPVVLERVGGKGTLRIRAIGVDPCATRPRP